MEGVINFNANKIVVSKCQMCLVLLVCMNAIRVSLKGEVQCLKEEVLESWHINIRRGCMTSQKAHQKKKCWSKGWEVH
jgi:hypothetical protein